MNADRKHRHQVYCAGGFTLVEILVVLAVTGIVTAGLVNFMISQSRGYNLQEDLAEMEQNARIALEFFTNKLRKASSVVVFTTDDRPDDDIIPLIEIDGDRFSFRKRNAAGDPANEADSERIFRSTGNIAYFLQDVDGNGALDFPVFQQNGDTVTVTIVGRTRRPVNGSYRQILLTSKVVLRNS